MIYLQSLLVSLGLGGRWSLLFFRPVRRWQLSVLWDYLAPLFLWRQGSVQPRFALLRFAKPRFVKIRNNPLVSMILSVVYKLVLDSRAQYAKLEAPIISQRVIFRSRDLLGLRPLYLTQRWHPASGFLGEFNPHHIRDVDLPSPLSRAIVETIYVRRPPWDWPTLDERHQA